jgi:sorting nexin-29
VYHFTQLLSLYLKNENKNECFNYRGISLLNTGYKVYTKIINACVQTITEVLLLQDQYGFSKGRSCTYNVFTLNQIIEKRREFNMETHIGFIVLENFFDRVNRGKVWEILDKRGYSKHLIKTLGNIYNGTKVKI